MRWCKNRTLWFLVGRTASGVTRCVHYAVSIAQCHFKRMSFHIEMHWYTIQEWKTGSFTPIQKPTWWQQVTRSTDGGGEGGLPCLARWTLWKFCIIETRLKCAHDLPILCKSPRLALATSVGGTETSSSDYASGNVAARRQPQTGVGRPIKVCSQQESDTLD